MYWLSCADEAAPALPVVWIVETGQRPRNLPERSQLRRSLARRVLARQFGLEEDAVAIGHEPAGRPLIVAPAGSGLHLSLAARSGVVAIALAHHPVGVDVEQVAPASDPALAVLHPDERRWLGALPSSARSLAFARLWSAKEAYVKALGTGFARAPESFRIVLDGVAGFTVHDAERGVAVSGCSRIMKNGGHESMAAALVVLG